MAEALGVISAIAGLAATSLEVCRKISVLVLSLKKKDGSTRDERDLQEVLFSLSRSLTTIQNLLLSRPELTAIAPQLDPALGDCANVLQDLTLQYTYQTSKSYSRPLIWLKRPPGDASTSLDLKRLEKTQALLDAWLRQFQSNANVIPPPEPVSDTNGQNAPVETRLTYAYVTSQRSRILQWLSQSDHREKHHELRRTRVDVIEARILQKDEFKEWRDSESSTKVLWCIGSPGSGKTVLTSYIIDCLGEHTPKQDYGVAYYYFDYKNQQPLNGVVALLVKQLCSLKPTFPKIVSELYDHAADDQQRPPVASLVQALHAICSQFWRAYIVLDAIDEHEWLGRREMLQFLQGLSRSPCKILITSRAEVPQIETVFSSCSVRLDIGPNREDISRYIEERIAKAPALETLRKEFKESIIAALVKKAKETGAWESGEKAERDSKSLTKRGEDQKDRYNFLLAALQVDWLLGQFTTERDIEAALEALPLDFSGTLDEAIDRMELQSESNRRLANKIMMWVVYAKRPLSMRELCQALAVPTRPEDRTGRNGTAQPTPDLVRQVCAGLISFDDSDSTVSLVHYSVHEYFRKRRGELYPQGPRHLALACLTYLAYENYQAIEVLEEGFTDAFRLHPFLDYVVHMWSSHCRDRHEDDAVDVDELTEDGRASYYREKSRLVREISDLTLSLLKSSEKKIAYLPTAEQPPGINQVLIRIPQRQSEDVTSLHLAARFGLLDEASVLLEDDAADACAANQSKVTPLHEAAREGSRKVASLLLEHGADPLGVDSDQKVPLHWAASSGRAEVVRLLLKTDRYESPDVLDGDQRTPLMLAASMGHTAVTRLLLSRGADLTSYDRFGNTPLHLACLNGQNAVCSALLSAGSDCQKKDRDGLTPLHVACRNAFEAVSRLLVRSGADLSSRDQQLLTPLHYATMSRNQALVELLLTNGADINAQDQKGETPLFKAIHNRDADMAQLLLFRGADFEQKTIQGTSLLRFAQLYGQEKVESLLRDYGARSDQGDTKKMKRPGSNGEAWRSSSTVGTPLSMNVPDKAQSPPHRPVSTADYEELVRAQTR